MCNHFRAQDIKQVKERVRQIFSQLQYRRISSPKSRPHVSQKPLAGIPTTVLSRVPFLFWNDVIQILATEEARHSWLVKLAGTEPLHKLAKKVPNAYSRLG